MCYYSEEPQTTVAVPLMEVCPVDRALRSNFNLFDDSTVMTSYVLPEFCTTPSSTSIQKDNVQYPNYGLSTNCNPIQTWWPPKIETVTRAPSTSNPSFENCFEQYLQNENVTRVPLDTRKFVHGGPSANVFDAKPMGVSSDDKPYVWHQSRIQYAQGGYSNAYLLLHLLSSKLVSDHKCTICNVAFYSNGDMFLHCLDEQDKMQKFGHCSKSINCLSIGLDLVFTQRTSFSDYFVQTKLFPHLVNSASNMQSRFTLVKFNLQPKHLCMSNQARQKLYMEHMKRVHLSLVHLIVLNGHLDIYSDCVFGFKHGICTMVKNFKNEMFSQYHKSNHVLKAINCINAYTSKRFLFNHIMVENSLRIYNGIFLKLNGWSSASLIDTYLRNHVNILICLPNDVSLEGIVSKYPLKLYIMDYECA